MISIGPTNERHYFPVIVKTHAINPHLSATPRRSDTKSFAFKTSIE
jgi:hypothetical protein